MWKRAARLGREFASCWEACQHLMLGSFYRVLAGWVNHIAHGEDAPLLIKRLCKFGFLSGVTRLTVPSGGHWPLCILETWGREGGSTPTRHFLSEEKTKCLYVLLKNDTSSVRNVLFVRKGQPFATLPLSRSHVRGRSLRLGVLSIITASSSTWRGRGRVRG